MVDQETGPSPNLEFDGQSSGEGEEIESEASDGKAAARFGLEQYLQEFLRDNWSKTELAGE